MQRIGDHGRIMGQAPSWIERWGITLIGTMLMAVLAGATVFPYPDTLVEKLKFMGF